MKRSPIKRTGIKRKPNKFGAERCENLNFTELAGRSFDSRLERDVANMLVIRQRAGEISELEFQKVYRLTDAQISYRCDFCFVEDGRPIALEAKGFEVERWLIIQKLWRYYGPCVLHIYKSCGGDRVRLAKTIMPVQKGQL